ncbi:MAG: guanylate kinase [Dehalococcoidales bacterium]|nr:guanylate kinase [Dehalococcoidales bacterium]
MTDKSLSPISPPTRPLLIILSGPSGVGKDAVLSRMKESAYPLQYITTLTTRPRRPNEKNKVDYNFVSLNKFQEMLQNNELLEWAHVYGNWYGVPREAVQQALDKGKDTIVKIDIQGAATIRKIMPQAISIFLMSPSKEELLTRLNQRHTESPADLALRLQTAEAEINQLPLFDYVVLNRWDEIDRAVEDIKAIITAEKCRVNPREITL